MKPTEKLGFIGLALYIALVIALPIGWVVNVVKLVQLDFQEPYKVEIIRGVGAVTPIGGIVGFIKITDK